MYDLIGDIHGYHFKLEQLLRQMNYTKVKGVWKHPERKVIFVGDYIDKGPEIRETIRLVRDMTEASNAIALMGNHEFNALAYDYKMPDGNYLRKHSDNNTRQHKETLAQFTGHQEEWQSHLRWFYELPLFLDLGFLRAVHACWDQANIDWLLENNYQRLTEDLLVRAHDKSSKAYTVIEETLKGTEFDIPELYAWKDKYGHTRTSNRLKWWVPPADSRYGDLLFNCPQNLASEKLPADLKINIYPAEAPPVFFGHYWLEDQYPVIQAGNVICLDYSVANGGSLVAYRWNGEGEIDKKHFVVVN